MTPRLRSSAFNCNNLLSAPLSLNDPLRCRVSSFRYISAPSKADRAAERWQGVRTIPLAMRSCASVMASMVISYVMSVY